MVGAFDVSEGPLMASATVSTLPVRSSFYFFRDVSLAERTWDAQAGAGRAGKYHPNFIRS